MLTYNELTDRLTAWARATPDVRAALVIGSRARRDHPADAWSDLDVLVFAHHPDQFIHSADWVTALAPVWLTFTERAGDGKTWERRTLFEGGLDVDVAFNPAEWLEGLSLGLPPDFADILRRGVNVLEDKEGHLQCMLEWHARAQKGEQYDTWLRGRFLEEWAHPRAVEQLQSAFAHYDLYNFARALLATMDLYRWLEDETAALWAYRSPQAGEAQAATATQKLLAEMV